MNLARSQADWRKLLRELALFLAPQRELRELAKRFDLARTRTRVLDLGDTAESTSRWSLHGVKIGANTSAAGEVFVRLVRVAGSATVQASLYRAVGGAAGELVAQGAGASGTVVPLAPANGSGLSGSVLLGAVSANETDDRHVLLVFPDWAARMHAVFDGSEPEHGELLDAFMDALEAAERAFTTSLDAFSQATETFLRTRWKHFHRSSESVAIEKDVEEDQGAIATFATGLLEDGRDNMTDELVAGRQSVPNSLVVATAGTFDPSNRGRGVLTAPHMFEWARAGLVALVCIDPTLGQERFRVSQHRDETGEDRLAKRELTVRRAFSDPEIGIKNAFLDRVLAIDSQHADAFGPATDWTIQGEDSRNNDRGEIALRIVESGTDFVIEGYTSSSLEPETRVFTTTPGPAGAAVKVLFANGSTLSGTAKLGTNPKAGDTGTLDLNPFARGDRVVFDVTVAEKGAFQEELALLYGFALESDERSKATIDDRSVTAGTLPPFEDAHD